MKIRTDFVTNSSSSSFIVVFNTKKDYDNKEELLRNKYWLSEDYVRTISYDIDNNKVSRKEVIDTLKDTFRADAEYTFAWKSMKWEEAREYIKTKEFKEKVNQYVNNMLDKYKEKLPDRGYYYAIIEYGDEDGDYFSKLEHQIMPHLPFVLKRISHH